MDWKISSCLNREVPKATGRKQHPLKKGEAEGQVVIGRVRYGKAHTGKLNFFGNEQTKMVSNSHYGIFSFTILRYIPLTPFKGGILPLNSPFEGG